MAHRSHHMRLLDVSRIPFARGLADASDAQLVEAFLAGQDEAALEALMRRHGRMVLGVCRRILQNSHDAEDAFQATFLVLVQKAAEVKPACMVANWLHGVAHRAAWKARSARARRARHERQVSTLPEPPALSAEPWDDVRRVIDDELRRLADTQRLPIILCDMEGQSIKEAARQLGWPQGTVAGRLARARKLLARRLERRGVSLSLGTLATVLSVENVSAAVPLRLLGWVCAAGAGRTSVEVTAITRGVLTSMLWAKIRRAAAMPLLVAVLGAGVCTTTALFSASPTAYRDDRVVVASGEAAQAAPREDIYKHKMFFVRLQLFERGPKPPSGFVAVQVPGEKSAQNDPVWQKKFPLILLREGERVNRLGGWTTRVWGIQSDQRDPPQEYRIGIFCDLMVKQPSLPRWTADNVALTLVLHKKNVQNPDGNEQLVRGQSFEVLRKVRLGAVERIIVEKNADNEPKSWLEVTIVRDFGTHPVLLRLRGEAPKAAASAPAQAVVPTRSRPLPKDSRGIVYAPGMDGVYTVTRIEADGEPLAAEAIERFGKTIWCTQGRMATPGRGLFDLGWDMPFELDATTTPKRITFRAQGPHGPLRFNAIYRLEGTDLTIAINESGEDSSFPTDFQTRKGSPFVVFTCKWWGPTP